MEFRKVVFYHFLFVVTTGQSLRTQLKTSLILELKDQSLASSVLFIPKKVGKLLFGVNHRKLDAVKVRDTYPLVRMDEYTDSLETATLLSLADCSSGYW